jgi:cytoskeletal protein CcmA (bactofilin family)
MNNLVFNTVASELLTLSTISNASLTIAGSVTISSSITIANDSLTVAGTVTVSQITDPVTIGNASLTVAGNVTISNSITIANDSLTVAGTVTVSQITDPVTIGNASLTVNGSVTVEGTVTINNATITTLISGSAFTSDSVTSTVVTGTGVVFPNTDISAQKVASLLVYNEGADTLTVSLQISPTTTDVDYIDDPDYTNYAIPGSTNKILSISRFAHYTRLQYILGGATATFSAYYNAQA